MSIVHKQTKSWGSGSSQLAAEVSLTGDVEVNVEENIETGVHAFPDVAFTAAKLKSLYILSKDENVTFKTNSSGSPADNFQLTAGCPFTWDHKSGVPYPFAGAVTAAYFEIDESPTSDTDIEVRILKSL